MHIVGISGTPTLCLEAGGSSYSSVHSGMYSSKTGLGPTQEEHGMLPPNMCSITRPDNGRTTTGGGRIHGGGRRLVPPSPRHRARNEGVRQVLRLVSPIDMPRTQWRHPRAVLLRIWPLLCTSPARMTFGPYMM